MEKTYPRWRIEYARGFEARWHLYLLRDKSDVPCEENTIDAYVDYEEAASINVEDPVRFAKTWFRYAPEGPYT